MGRSLLFTRWILNLKDQLDEMVRRSCEEAETELVEFDVFQAGNRKILRLFIDQPQGVSVETCATVSRSLSARLDLEDLIPQAYTIEVSSPGLDRPLKSTLDFERNMGRLLRITRPKGAPITGRLLAVSEETLTLSPSKGKGPDQLVTRAEILVAKVEVEL